MGGKCPYVVMKFVGAKYGNKNVKIILWKKWCYVMMKYIGGKSEQRTYPQGIPLLYYIYNHYTITKITKNYWCSPFSPERGLRPTLEFPQPRDVERSAKAASEGFAHERLRKKFHHFQRWCFKTKQQTNIHPRNPDLLIVVHFFRFL